MATSLPLRLIKIYWRMVSWSGNEGWFEMEEPPRERLAGHRFYMNNPQEFYARYGDGLGESLFEDSKFKTFCPKSYSKKKCKEAKEEIIKWIFNKT